MSQQPTPLYLLIEERLGEPLADWIAARRPGKSWRLISREIWEVTGVDVSFEAIRIWAGADSTESAA
jgi:hypothetical protein